MHLDNMENELIIYFHLHHFTKLIIDNIHDVRNPKLIHIIFIRFT